MQNRYRRSLLMVTVLLGAAVGIATQAPAQFIQQGPKLVGSGPVGLAAQGHVALSADGDTAIVGGPGDNGGIGAAWVYTRRGGVWTQQGSKLVGNDAVGDAAQGWSVALSADGNIAIVGGNMDNSGSGAAWVFTRRHGAWTQQGSKLVGNDAVGPNSQQGNSVSLSADGNTAIVGGPSDNGGIGAAWVYTRRGGVWTQQGSKLVGTTGAVGKRAEQGFSVALSADGDTAIVGGPLYSLFLGGEPVGAAWVFTRSDGVWTQQGDKLLGTGVTSGCARQGNSVALSADGDTAIVGGPEDAGCFVFGTGAAWVFTRSDGVWTQQGGKLVGAGGARARQGSSVALSGDGNTAIVGGPCDGCITVAPRRGAAWVFTRTDGIWTS